MSNSAFTPVVLAVGSAGGAGELNVIGNPSGGSAGTAGWTNVAAISGATSPLNPTVSTGFSISNAATTEGPTSGGYYSITAMPSGLQNRKLKVEFYFTTPATDVYKVSVYKGSTRVALSTDSGGSTSLPASVTGGKFVAYFDTDTSAAWTVNITRTNGTTGPCYITNVVVGPGIQPQGAVVGEWQNFTPVPTESNTDRTAGFSTLSGQYRRVGSSLEFVVKLKRTAVSIGAGTNQFGLRSPFGTINVSSLPITFAGYYLPSVNIKTSATEGDGSGIISTAVSSNTILFEKQLATTALYYNDTDLPTSGEIGIYGTLPIAEWAGSGTVQLAQNDVEYAWNSDPGTTASATYSNAAYYGYGPSGTPIVAVNSTTNTGESKTNYAVKFQTPVQAGDQVVVELNDGNGWFSAALRLPNVTLNAASYGVSLIAVDSTTYRVSFGNAGYAANGATTYGAAGGAWSTVSSWKWRVRKSSAGAAVGFGIVVPGTSAGLVSASGLPGNTTGNAIASGYVGQKITWTTPPASQSLTTSYADWTNANIVLPAGVWLIQANISVNYTTGGATGNIGSAFAAITDSTNTIIQNMEKQLTTQTASNTTVAITSALPFSFVANLSTDTTYKIRARKNDSSGTGSGTIFNQAAVYSEFFAIRIA